jgi:VanZ family protein
MPKMIRKNKFSIIIALIILYLSLASSETFDKVSVLNIPLLDKIVHFLMYFSLMWAILIENRKSLKGIKQLLIIALIPFSYGILMEIFQEIFTDSRSGSFFDIISDSAGVLIAFLLWLLLSRFAKWRSDSY